MAVSAVTRLLEVLASETKAVASTPPYKQASMFFRLRQWSYRFGYHPNAFGPTSGNFISGFVDNFSIESRGTSPRFAFSPNSLLPSNTLSATPAVIENFSNAESLSFATMVLFLNLFLFGRIGPFNVYLLLLHSFSILLIVDFLYPHTTHISSQS